MNNQPTAFFFEIQPIPDDSLIFDEFKNQTISFSYFQVDQKYYLFFYSQKPIDIDLIESFIDILEELDTKQRKIRSLRGFFLYALEIFERTNNSQILKTNLKASFWRNLKTILRQNKKQVLLQFLFGRGYSYQDSSSNLEDQIQTLHNQVDSLQQKIFQLENNQPLQIKKALSELLECSQAFKIDQQDDSTLKPNIGSYLHENHSKVNLEVKEPRNEISKTVSEVKISPVTPLSHSQQRNISSNQEKGLQEPNFITLGRIPEQERIEIIQRGFQLQAEGKISLKKYYESTEQYSLFQLKGYSIKYETVRRTKLYQNLKE